MASTSSSDAEVSAAEMGDQLTASRSAGPSGKMEDQLTESSSAGPTVRMGDQFTASPSAGHTDKKKWWQKSHYVVSKKTAIILVCATVVILVAVPLIVHFCVSNNGHHTGVRNSHISCCATHSPLPSEWERYYWLLSFDRKYIGKSKVIRQLTTWFISWRKNNYISLYQYTT